MLALLIVITLAVVLIQRERAISAAIYPQFDGIGGFLAGVLQLRPHGDDRSGAHIEWHRFKWSCRVHRLSALQRRASPEVIPARPSRKINASRRGARLRHRTH